MILFTDLDESLIFSERFMIKHYNKPTIPGLVKVEDIRDDLHTFMCKDSIDLIRYIQRNRLDIRIVPNTARRIEQYNRIDFKSVGIDFEYAIIKIGAAIYYKGKTLEEFDRWKQQTYDIIPIEYLLKKLSEIDNKLGGIISSLKTIDGNTAILKFEAVEEGYLEDFEDLIRASIPEVYVIKSPKFWEVIPNYMTKGIAMNWLCNYLGDNECVAFGDGELEICMINSAKYGDIPTHSSLKDTDKWSLLSDNAIQLDGNEKAICTVLNNMIKN